MQKKVSAGALKTWPEAKKWFKVYLFAYNYNYFLLHEMKALTLEIDEIFELRQFAFLKVWLDYTSIETKANEKTT